MRHGASGPSAVVRVERSVTRLLGAATIALLAFVVAVQLARANNTHQSLPYSQNWSNTGLITVNDDWASVPGVIGYRGDGLTSVNDVDPQTVLGEGPTPVVDVNANQTNPNTFTTGGVTEFHLADPVVALTGSGTADAPYLVFHVDTTGLANIQVAYNLRDVDGSTDNAAQQVALQFRAGSTGDFTNVPAGYVADATSGPSLATLVTPVSATLPAAAGNQSALQVRVITTNATGNDEWVGVDDVSITGTVADQAPQVSTTTPADGATGVALATSISIGFSEAVDVTGSWFDITCSTSGAHTATVSGGPQSFTLDPDADFSAGESCTVTVDAAAVTDQDTNDPPDNMAADYSASFTTAPPVTPISVVQGSGDTVTPGTFTVEAIVVGDYQTQGSGQLRGFFVQEEDADVDANPATSEGIFVFCSGCPVAVSVGDRVRVTGASSEFFGMSQLTASTAGSVSVLSSGNPLPTPASVDLPVPGVPSGDLTLATAAVNAYFEAFEGMLVLFPDTLSVSEYFELARYGQVILTEGGRPHQFTHASAPSAAGLIDHEIDLLRRTVILDDADNRQNRPVDTPNTAYYHPVPGLSISNYFRGGDTITNLAGVLHWSFAGQTGTDAWRIRPVTEAYGYAFTSANPRPAVPTVGGQLRVASFNVLNYFLTIDTTASSSVGTCGPSGTLDCRGADSSQELVRQRAKLLAALQGVDADVVGVMEMENSTGVEPLADIVAGLPGYSYVDTGVIGQDAIRVGLIYRAATVQPVGSYAILDSTVDPDFDDTRNRPALAQTFEEVASGARFTVVVNHLKSKGTACGPGDDDTTTGQGNCNGTRTAAAQALVDWLATDPTSSGDPDFLIIGDLNSYAKEDPIAALESGGYTNLVASFGGPGAYSYVFDGQLGYLDHALANASLAAQVSGVGEWHVNADEIPLFDYNDDVRDTGEATFEEESDTLPLYAADAVRTSDHDPVLVGMSPLSEATSLQVTGTFYDDNGAPTPLTAKLTGAGACDVEGKSVAFYVDLNGDGSFTDSPDELVGSGTTNASGVAQVSWSTSSTPAWAAGIWEVKAVFAGTPNCDASSDLTTIAVVGPGDSANGGGWYQFKTTGSPRVNFAFAVRKQRDGSYKGQLIWHNNEKWRIKGTLSSFGKTDPCTYAGTSGLRCGSSQGAGKLYRWNGSTLEWDYVQDVGYVVNFVDGGSAKKGGAKPDYFGINVTSFSDPGLPESAPQQLKGGNVQVP